LAYQDEFFVNNPLDVKEADEHALNFAFSPVSLFRSALNKHAIQTAVYGSCFLL
jgi:hypothetical protein